MLCHRATILGWHGKKIPQICLIKNSSLKNLKYCIFVSATAALLIFKTISVWSQSNLFGESNNPTRQKFKVDPSLYLFLKTFSGNWQRSFEHVDCSFANLK